MTTILCPKCGHDIDKHHKLSSCTKCQDEWLRWSSVKQVEDICRRAPSDIAQALLAAEPTEVEAAQWLVESTHQFQGDTCLCGFRSPVSRQRTEHITGALSAALRTARGLS